MGLLTRFREWVDGILGGSGADGATPETAERDGAAGNDGSVEDTDGTDASDGLDPAAVTETRSEATDDAVDALRIVRESAPTGDTDGENAVAADGDQTEHESADDPADRSNSDRSETDP